MVASPLGTLHIPSPLIPKHQVSAAWVGMCAKLFGEVEGLARLDAGSGLASSNYGGTVACLWFIEPLVFECLVTPCRDSRLC
jgi:hypothetical protein